MSLKLSDIQARKSERYPDFELDASDETGQELELRFRSVFVMTPQKREAVKAAFEEIASEDSSEEQALDSMKEIFRVTARDPYHFEVLDAYVDEHTPEGDDVAAMWGAIFDLYAEATQLGEA